MVNRVLPSTARRDAKRLVELAVVAKKFVLVAFVVLAVTALNVVE